MINDINWREPLWLLVALQPWLVFAGSFILSRFSPTQYAEPALLPWASIRHTQGFAVNKVFHFGLLALAWACFAIALAGPRTPRAIYSTQQQQFAEVMLVVDVSRSMSARDIAPSRLQRAKLELTDLLRRTQGLRIGIVVYAAKPHLLVPPTTDKQLLTYYLNQLHSKMLPTEGSDLHAAIKFAAANLSTSLPGTTNRPHALLLVTDGETNDSAQASLALQQTVQSLAKNGMQLYILGTGTRAGSPVLSDSSGWLTDNGSEVISRMNAGLLKNLAATGNGKFATISNTDSEWQTLYHDGLANLQQQTSLSDRNALVEWQEHYPVWLFVGMLLFLFGHLNYRRHNTPENIPRNKPVARHRATQTLTVTATALILAASLLLTKQNTWAAGNTVKPAYSAYTKQAYQTALELYANLPGFTGRMGEGSSAYKLENYARAVQAFTLAVLDADTDKQRASALFNLANSYFQLENYPLAAAIYKDALRYQPAFRAAHVNLGYAEALQQQQDYNPTGLADRANRGIRSLRAPDGLDITKGSVSIDESSDPDAKIKSDNAHRSENADELKNIQQATSVTQRIEEFDDNRWQYNLTSTQTITQYIKTIHTDESIFWQRVFEHEEDFPAPLDQPRQLPGVKPW